MFALDHLLALVYVMNLVARYVTYILTYQFLHNTYAIQCNEEGYTGNGTLCARDSDHDTFPDVALNCSSPTCSKV